MNAGGQRFEFVALQKMELLSSSLEDSSAKLWAQEALVSLLTVALVSSLRRAASEGEVLSWQIVTAPRRAPEGSIGLGIA